MAKSPGRFLWPKLLVFSWRNPLESISQKLNQFSVKPAKDSLGHFITCEYVKKSLQEVPNIVIWFGIFWYFIFGILVAEERWSLTRGGCLQEVPNIVIWLRHFWHFFDCGRQSQPEVWLYMAYNCFKKEPIKTLRSTSQVPCHMISMCNQMVTREMRK